MTNDKDVKDAAADAAMEEKAKATNVGDVEVTEEDVAEFEALLAELSEISDEGTGIEHMDIETFKELKRHE